MADAEHSAGELAEAVRRKIRLTYEDSDAEARMADIMADGKEDLRYALGLPSSYGFEEPGSERALFLDWCFYAWNDAEDDFYVNFAAKIDQCRQKWMVAQFVEEEDAD